MLEPRQARARYPWASVCLAACTLLSGGASATPPDPASVASAADARAAQLTLHLDTARRAQKNARYPAAIAAFTAALALEPTNARILGERGWAYFRAEQFTKAEADLKAALQADLPRKTRGALLYNLGRVAEARGKPQDALALFAQSLAARPHKGVSARRDALKAIVTSPLGLARLPRA